MFTMPLIAFLVVCGIDETMLIFSPLAVFKKVDFPAEGLPIMETTPDFLLTVDDSSLFIANIIEKKLRFCYRSFLRGKSSPARPLRWPLPLLLGASP